MLQYCTWMLWQLANLWGVNLASPQSSMFYNLMLFQLHNPQVGEHTHIGTGSSTHLYGINFAVPPFEVFECDGQFGKHLLSDCIGPFNLISLWSWVFYYKLHFLVHWCSVLSTALLGWWQENHLYSINCCLPRLIAEFVICVFIAAHDTGTSFVHPDTELTMTEHR